MYKKTNHFCLLIVCLCFIADAAAIVESNRNYSYIYWEYGIPTPLGGRRPQSQANSVARNNPNVIIETGYYSLKLNCDDMELAGYDALTGSDYITALHQDITHFSSAQLNLYVYKDGVRYKCTSGLVIDQNNAYVRLIESGQFLQRFDHTGLVFTDNNNNTLAAKGRLEIAAWPDQVVLQLDFRNIPDVTRTTIELISPSGKTHLSDTMNDHVFMALKPHLDQKVGTWNASSYITDAYNLKTSEPLSYTFDKEVHALQVEINADRISFPADIDRVDEYLIEVTNPTESPLNIPVVFDQVPPRAITGTVMVLSNETDGSPDGIPVQISKNWHKSTTNPTLHEGSWLRGSTVFLLAAGESKRIRLRIIYGHWAGVPAASHAQLCLIGYGGNWKWDQSALGAWGESYTFDPTQHLGAAFMCDIRPAFTTSMNGSTHGWTENSGGGDFLIYYDADNKFRWVKRSKTAYRWTGPNMTEIHYSGVTDDEKIRFTYIDRLPQTYDYHRRIQRFRYEFLQDVIAPQRLVFFQMAADYYTGPEFDYYYVGNSSGLLSSHSSQPGGNVYKHAFDFTDKWLAIDDVAGANECRSRRGILLRDFTVNGSASSPYVHTFGRSWGTPKMLFDLSSESVNRSYATGDVVEGEIVFVMPPKSSADYWGLDEEFSGRLDTYDSNAWQAVFDEYQYNQLSITAHAGTLKNNCPVEIKAANSSVLADFTINGGGIGHVPVVITNVTRGIPVSVQRYVDGAWYNFLLPRAIAQNNYYQGYQNHDGRMDYVFSIDRPSKDLEAGWRVRIVKGSAIPDGTVYQAEDYAAALGCVVQMLWAGYTGTGYVDMGGNGTWFEWNTIDGGSGGISTLDFRYALGAGKERECRISVNGTSVGTVVFSSTGSWSTWSTESFDVMLGSGANTIRITASTGEGGPNVDRMDVKGGPVATPPTPDPMAWSSVPKPLSAKSVKMTASTAVGDESGVEYYFACIAGDGNDSGWQTSETYVDTGLAPNTRYAYQVKARNISGNQDETANSMTAFVTTLNGDADITGDGLVDMQDFLILASWWVDDQCQHFFDCMGADINGDGIVDIEDLSVLARQWLGSGGHNAP